MSNIFFSTIEDVPTSTTTTLAGLKEYMNMKNVVVDFLRSRTSWSFPPGEEIPLACQYLEETGVDRNWHNFKLADFIRANFTLPESGLLKKAVCLHVAVWKARLRKEVATGISQYAADVIQDLYPEETFVKESVKRMIQRFPPSNEETKLPSYLRGTKAKKLHKIDPPPAPKKPTRNNMIYCDWLEEAKQRGTQCDDMWYLLMLQWPLVAIANNGWNLNVPKNSFQHLLPLDEDNFHGPIRHHDHGFTPSLPRNMKKRPRQEEVEEDYMTQVDGPVTPISTPTPIPPPTPTPTPIPIHIGCVHVPETCTISHPRGTCTIQYPGAVPPLVFPALHVAIMDLRTYNPVKLFANLSPITTLPVVMDKLSQEERTRKDKPIKTSQVFLTKDKLVFKSPVGPDEPTQLVKLVFEDLQWYWDFEAGTDVVYTSPHNNVLARRMQKSEQRKFKVQQGDQLVYIPSSAFILVSYTAFKVEAIVKPVDDTPSDMTLSQQEK
jgi:hypothetical protein